MKYLFNALKKFINKKHKAKEKGLREGEGGGASEKRS